MSSNGGEQTDKPARAEHKRVYTFAKAEHLCAKRTIDALFAPGNQSMAVFPLRAVYRTHTFTGSGPRVRVLLSVSKRRFRHATDRNRAKRQLREAYRLQKHLLLDRLPESTAVDIAFIWLSAKPVDTSLVFARMRTALLRTAEKVGDAAQGK